MKVEIKGSIPSITTQSALRLDSQTIKAFSFFPTFAANTMDQIKNLWSA
ncbi:hypothetical protein [Dyadobacter soli]|nr:hypothetical protein [Dyadobacter soli]